MATLSFGDLVSKSFEEYQKNFMIFAKMLFFLYFIPRVGIIILQTLLSNMLGGPVEEFDIAMLGTFGSLVLAMIGLAIATLILYMIMYIGIVQIIAMKKTGKEITLGDVFESTKGVLGRYFLLGLLEFIFLVGLFLLLIVPGIIFSVYWSFAAFVLILEKKDAMESLSESKKLVEGRWWRVFGYQFLWGLIMLGIGIGVGILMTVVVLPLSFVPVYGNALGSIISEGISMFIVPVGIIFMEKFYQGLKSGHVLPRKA